MDRIVDYESIATRFGVCFIAVHFCFAHIICDRTQIAVNRTEKDIAYPMCLIIFLAFFSDGISIEMERF